MMYQTYIIIILSVATLIAIMQAAKSWQIAKGLRQIIDLSPEVCEICATKASKQNHTPVQGHISEREPGNGGIYFADTHLFVPSRLVFTPPPHSLEGTPGFSEDPLGG